MKRYITLLLMLISAAASAQKLTVEAPNVVAMDETFRIIFTAEGNMSDFDWPGSEDFQIVWGPQKGSMSSTTIVNGKRESVHQESCTYILQPTKEGKFTIPAATCTIDKKSCSSGSVTIEVVGAQQQVSGQTQQQSGGTSSQGQQSQDSQNSDPAVTGTVSNQDIFMRLTLSKTNVMKGEPITGVLKFYTRTDIAGFEDVKFPTFNGFWSKETYTPQNIEFNRESVDGKIYNVAVIRRYMLIPQQEGRITIDPAEMVCQVRVRTTGGGRSIFDDFFDNYQTIRKRVSTGAVTVNVKGLPAGAPASFKGGVGEYRISAQMSADSVKTNEAASLKITIAGNGNISMLEAPKVEFPGDFEVYDIKSTENVTANGASGTKTFEYPFIPRSYGDFKIGPINYSYYDVQKGQYVTVTAPEMNFKVIRGEGYDEGGVIVPGTVRQSVKNIGEDVRFIHTGNPGLRYKGKFFVLSPLFWGLIALIALLFFIGQKIDRLIG
ncbi:MAG: protein BatD, partial [Bacteroidales bacterium]|nr:protein BatD [Bacteroidales bacterium]